MKWTDKGRQLDGAAPGLLKEYGRCDRYYLYGASYYGKALYPVLQKLGRFGGLIDNDEKKQKKGYDGQAVISFESFQALDRPGIIILCAGPESQREMAAQLEGCGMKQGRDFYSFEYFCEYLLPIVFAYGYDQCFVRLCQIVLTNRCTMRCEKCAHGCQVKQEVEELTLEEACNTADCFFERVDYVQEFVLIGGEPLLYKELPQVICYIGQRYASRIGSLLITTNGTIPPSKPLLEACGKYGVRFTISDYSLTLPRLKPGILGLMNRLDQYGIEYDVIAYREWLDCGFDTVFHDDDHRSMTELFDRCRMACREIRGGRYYYCVCGRASFRSYGYPIDRGDYLDFGTLQGDYKKIILEYNLGYCENGYLQMCRRCNGSFKCNPKKIPPAIQLTNREE